MFKTIAKIFRKLFGIQTREELLERSKKEKLQKQAQELRDSFPDDIQTPLKK